MLLGSASMDGVPGCGAGTAHRPPASPGRRHSPPPAVARPAGGTGTWARFTAGRHVKAVEVRIRVCAVLPVVHVLFIAESGLRRIAGVDPRRANRPMTSVIASASLPKLLKTQSILAKWQ